MEATQIEIDESCSFDPKLKLSQIDKLNYNQASKSDRYGLVTTYQYDRLNRLVPTVDAAAGETVFGCENWDNLLALTDAGCRKLQPLELIYRSKPSRIQVNENRNAISAMNRWVKPTLQTEPLAGTLCRETGGAARIL